MGGFQVARPTVDPIQAPDVLGNFQRIQALRGAQQEQQFQAQEEPNRQQIMQNTAQQGQVDLQNSQQDQQDNLSFRSAMQDPALRGKTVGQIADILAQQGKISQKGWQGAKEADLKTQQSLSTMADTAIKTTDAAYKATQPIYDSVQKMDDQTLAANWGTIAQQYDAIWQPVIAANPQLRGKMPVLDPNQPMTKDQLSQFGPMLSMGQAYSDAETKRRAAELKLKNDQATADFYAKNGGAPGITEGEQQQADWLKKNPGKGPSDYVAWKAKQAPLAQFSIMNSTGNGQPAADVARKFGMSAEAFDQAAERFSSTGELPPSGRGGPALAKNQAIMNHAAELHPGQSLAANSAEYKANTDSLKKLQASADQVNSFEETANKNIEMLKGIAAKVPDLGAKFANVPVRMLSGSMIGSENMAAFKTALAPVQAESAKILNSANLQGQLSDSSRHELQDIIDGNLPYKSLVASLNVLQQDFKNRKTSMADQINTIRGRLGGSSNTGVAQGGGSASVTITLPSGKKVTIE